MRIWSRSMIRELLATAVATGEVRAELASRSDAERFRYGIYAFRRAHNTGYDVTIRLDENTVVVTKKDVPEVRIVPIEEPAHESV